MAADPRRPRYHVTAPAGWINDPLGVTWHEDDAGGRYELFYQFNPDAPTWAPACRWGQVTSPDLVRWRDPRTALEPGPHETGCWSGSVVVDGGVPVIVYTSVLADALGLGRVALAEGDAGWRRWTPDPAGPVIPAPRSGFAHVRDPYVWRAGDEWRMVLGAGSTDGRPSLLQYSSPDLRRWRRAGALLELRPSLPVPGGSVWECPQLFPLGDSWVLIVSVWDGEPGGVVCGVGDYDGTAFTPRSWQPLAGNPLYATTAFADSAGRRCAMSWVQEAGPVEGAWAGALSVPWLLGLDRGRVTVTPHPDVATLRTGVRGRRAALPLSADPVVVGPVGPAADVELWASPGGGAIVLTLDDAGRRLLTVERDPVLAELRLAVPGRPDVRAPVPTAPGGALHLRLLLDGGVVEVFAGGTVAAAQLRPSGGELALGLSATAPGARLRELVVHGMRSMTG